MNFQKNRSIFTKYQNVFQYIARNFLNMTSLKQSAVAAPLLLKVFLAHLKFQRCSLLIFDNLFLYLFKSNHSIPRPTFCRVYCGVKSRANIAYGNSDGSREYLLLFLAVIRPLHAFRTFTAF